MNKKVKDLKKVAKREKTFSTLAKKEGKEAAIREKAESKSGLKQSAKDSQWETKIDKKFADIRKHKVAVIEKQLNKVKK